MREPLRSMNGCGSTASGTERLSRGLKASGLRAGSLFKVNGFDPRKVLLADRRWRCSRPQMSASPLRYLGRKSAIREVTEERKHFLKGTDATAT